MKTREQSARELVAKLVKKHSGDMNAVLKDIAENSAKWLEARVPWGPVATAAVFAAYSDAVEAGRTRT